MFENFKIFKTKHNVIVVKESNQGSDALKYNSYFVDSAGQGAGDDYKSALESLAKSLEEKAKEIREIIEQEKL